MRLESGNRRKLVLTACAVLLVAGLPATAADAPPKATAFESGKTWLDTEGQPIHAHGGGILERRGIYYWYGDPAPGACAGVSAYFSKDLLNWKPLGVVLPPENLPAEIRNGGVCERPKVIYNELTGKYVMWMHLDNRRYTVASAGVAVSDQPGGPFRFERQIRPIKFDFGYPERDRCQQKELGNTFRDMNLFVDDDGRAYVFYASEDNRTLYMVKLNEEYTAPEMPAIEGRTWARLLVDQMREAPAPFKYRGKYYLITSGCTGWAPNQAQVAVANSILGPWQGRSNPCAGPGGEKTFGAQSTFVLPAPGKPPGYFIFMADRWERKNLKNSTYVWLPFKMRPDGGFVIEYRERWDWSFFTTTK